MKVLFIGDVCGPCGLDMLKKHLKNVKIKNNIDFCIVNGENAATPNGIDKQSAQSMFLSGADVITTGNHVFYKKEMKNDIEEMVYVIRPANLKGCDYGKGYVIYDMLKYRICVINLLGTVYMENTQSPFSCIDEILDETKGQADLYIVDMHAEATSEKKAFWYYVRDKVKFVVGTHTHCQTADEQIHNGSAYITDAGMCGAEDSILGVTKESSLGRFLGGNDKFYPAEGKGIMTGVIAEFNDKFEAVKIERIKVL